MDSNSDVDDLPYVVWYQCRMCTHVFCDDIEMMFEHFSSKHGAMIDCEELQSIVYKNGLAMGGLPRSRKSTSASSDTADDLKSSVSVTLEEDEDYQNVDEVDKDEENDDGINTDREIVQYNEANGDEDYAQNGDYEDECYEESAYQTNGNELNCKQEMFSVHDDEEQLAEGDFDEDVNGDEDYDEQYENDEIDTQETEEGLVLDDYDDLEEDPYHDDGEEDISGEQSIDDDEEYDDDELEEEENGQLSRNGNYSNGIDPIVADILNYGFSCRFCGKFFSTRRGVESHEQHHKTVANYNAKRPHEGKRFPCKICKAKSFSSFKDLKMHVKSHTTDRIHICKFCFVTFHNTASLTKHLTIHKRENPNKCFCGKTFVSANTLKIHKKIHTGIKPFVCEFNQCGRAFVTKSTLESHLRTHTGEKPYQCGYCSSSFTTSSAKYRHERHVHKVPDPAPM